MLTPLLTLLLLAAQAAPSQDTDEARRMERVQFPEILAALRVKEGSRVADLGTGDGVLTVPLARAVGASGQVFAADIDEPALKRLRKRIEEKRVANVVVIPAAEDDPKLPGELDAVLMVDTYHEVKRQPEVIRHVFDSLKPGGRLVVVDAMPVRTRKQPRADQTKNHVLAPEIVERELREAGFEMIDRRDAFVDRPDEERASWMIVAARPAKAAAASVGPAPPPARSASRYR